MTVMYPQLGAMQLALAHASQLCCLLQNACSLLFDGTPYNGVTKQFCPPVQCQFSRSSWFILIAAGVMPRPNTCQPALGLLAYQ